MPENNASANSRQHQNDSFGMACPSRRELQRVDNNDEILLLSIARHRFH